MKKEQYEKPLIKVYAVEQQCQILAGSPTEVTRQGYGDAVEDTWE